MIFRSEYLSAHPRAFQAMTGMTLAEFDDLVADLRPRLDAAEAARRARPHRRRAPGGGHPYELLPRDRFLVVVVWLRHYPTHEVLAYLFGVSAATILRTIAAILPLLEAAGRDTMRLPDPGKSRRKTLDGLLHDTPELAVIVDTFEQAVQRPRDRAAADALYSGKKKRHTLKSQIAVEEVSGRIADVSDSVPGPTADIRVLEDSRLLHRLPAEVGALGDLAYVGIAALHPQGLAAAPRRKPRGKPRPAEDIAYNREFARRRVIVEHAIGRMRRYQAVNQVDRHHRRGHARRTVAVAGLVNRRLEHQAA